EAVDGGGILAIAQIIAAHRHFLAGQLVIGDEQLFLGVGGVFGLGVVGDEQVVGIDGVARQLLVAGDVLDLRVIGRGLEPEHVIAVAASGVVRQIAIRR